jgi:hypothetical protein
MANVSVGGVCAERQDTGSTRDRDVSRLNTSTNTTAKQVNNTF